jgi:hypothetical protein
MVAATPKWQQWKMDGCPYLNAVAAVASGKHGHLVNKVMSSCNKQGVAGLFLYNTKPKDLFNG